MSIPEDPQQILDKVFANDTDFQNCMGDYYPLWKDYIIENTPEPLTILSLTQAFRQWAMQYAPNELPCEMDLVRACEVAFNG